MRIEEQQLKTFLLDARLAGKEDVDAAEKQAAEKGSSLGDVLVKAGKISAEDLSRVKAYILGIPFVSLEHETVAPEILQIIPEPIARKHNIVAYRKDGMMLEVAMLDPGDLETIAFVRKKSNLKIQPRLTTPRSIRHLLDQYHKNLQAEFGDIIKKEVASIISEDGTLALTQAKEETADASEADLQKLAEDLPVVRIMETLISHAVVQRASDIHIEPTEEEVVVRYRIDGILHDAMTLPKHIAPAIVARVKVLAALKLDEHRLPQDGRFKIKEEGNGVSLRVSVLPVYDGEKVVIRLLREQSKGHSFESLGLLGEAAEKMHRALKQTVGMVLITGPTGSGKTTTLYTMMDLLNAPEVNISTIEDPIEYRIPRVNQTQVRPEIGLSFANGLRSLVRQDPDIIMVGEIRDGETAKLAVNAALTGHLVLSTLHTNSASGALPRLLDLGAEPFLIVSTVSVIAAQRLVRRLCAGKKPFTLSQEQHIELAEEVDMDQMLALLRSSRVIASGATWKDVTFYEPVPSEDCPDGYQERVGIFEVLPLSEAVKTLVTRGASAEDIEKQAKEEGMITMLEDGIMKAAQGVTSLSEVLRVVRE
ncbi:MAG: type II/IV secretion system protein [Parcubacteria group bacterium]|nr:type II/IV secretion system protein [Parcubacteria group bacterium]